MTRGLARHGRYAATRVPAPGGPGPKEAADSGSGLTQEKSGGTSVQLLERAIASTEKILSGVSPKEFEKVTLCASWKARDLVDHIVGSTYWFADPSSLVVTVSSNLSPGPSGGS